VRDTVSLGNHLLGKFIYIACDKGNKKGVSHFVKVLCWWQEGRVFAQVLDIASGGTTEECADAILASMNKLKALDGDATHLLCGQGADSGGGGVLDGLTEALKQRSNLCIPMNEHLVANCCVHALQLQLRNAAVSVFGEGGLEKINVMQMLHSVYDLQESLDQNEWRHILWKSTEFVYAFDPTHVSNDEAAVAIMPAADKHRNTFCQAFNAVRLYHTKFKKDEPVDPTTLTKFKGTIYSKVLAPMLTRWWTVGAGATHLFRHCLQFCHVCQSLINTCASDSRANRIASSLFALMTDQENFLDMCLIYAFNRGHIPPNLDWLQSCDDLTLDLGFQAHNIAVRHFLMDRLSRSLLTHNVCEDYHEAIEGVDPDGAHLDKLKTNTSFIGCQMSCCRVH